jgi:D-alanine-D-alanine ligase
VKNETELKNAVSFALEFDTKVLIESAITAREIECAVLQADGKVIASPIGQIVIDAKYEFYDFTAKYLDNSMQLVFPTDLPAGIESKIQESAIKAFNAAGCEGLARVDFFYTTDGEIVINEINTMPGFTPLSVYPKLIAKDGISYQELITKLITTALTRSAHITR